LIFDDFYDDGFGIMMGFGQKVGVIGHRTHSRNRCGLRDKALGAFYG